MDVRDFVRQVFIHGVPYEQASRYDASAMPTLLAMLRDPAEEQYWANIVVVLGMIGDERVVEPMISFIQSDPGPAGLLSPAQYRAKTSALMALGYLVNRTGNQRALNYLQESARPEAWASRGVAGTAPFQASTTERNLDLSKHAILGLALSGRPEAAQTLRSLQQPAATAAARDFQAQVGDLVSEALNEHQRVSSQGLAEYDRTLRR
jgi:HEAT repeat protein